MSDASQNDNEFLIPLDSNLTPPRATVPSSSSLTVTRKRGDDDDDGNSYLTMAKLIDNQWGPLPLSAQFPMHGGTLVISFSASVHTDKQIPSGTVAVVGYTIQVDGIPVGSAQTFIWSADVWNYCSTDLVVQNLAVGNHTVTIVPYGPYTSNDQFNIFNLTVLEF